MNPIVFIIWRPVTTLMFGGALCCGGLPALDKMCVDILPSLIHVK